ncbi:efflux RND transporter periplasmic adaptor subunit [Raineya orbicola]|uniref:HlyD n=1 Tax=Raineya orbicola TaxID=2016530 RepID=A0A2N3IKQ1_9BACT|nr:efflux RND transporter periplasmic adaptor subunit [Raineya orbicola]PKQ70874.1 HlyD [Raineya orbicola]
MESSNVMSKEKKKKSSKKVIGYLIGIVVILVVLSVFLGGNKKKLEQIEIAEVKNGTITEKVGASGKVQPVTEVKLSPDVSGEITELYVKEGDSVVKGQLLLRIRPDNYELAVQRSQATLNNSRAALAQAEARKLQAEAQFTRSQANYERQKKLFEQKVISELEFEQATAEYKVAQQELESAKQNVIAAQFNIQSASATVNETIQNLTRTSVYAPMSGVISKLAVEKGERVVGTAQMAGTELLRIANLNEMEVRVDVNENDIIRVSLGDTADVEVEAYRNRKFKGIVTAIANTANATVSAEAVTEFQVKVKILGESYQDLKAKSGRLSPFRPGTSASVEIITQTKRNIPVVPLAAVVAKSDEEVKKQTGKQEKTEKSSTDNTKDEKKGKAENEKKEYVFVYDEKNKKVALREVKTGISDFENIEIVSGLKVGEKIVIAPFQAIDKKLKDGDEVELKSK